MPLLHGIKIVEPATGIRALQLAATAVIGLVATASDADAEMFPLDRPVLVTDLRTALGQAGIEGTLAKSLQAIADQSTPIIVVVRVAEGIDAAETEANLIGASVAGQFTGMQALLAAESEFGVRPRILAAPGLDTQPVTEALAIVAKQLRGFVYARAIGDDTTAALAYRANFAQRELMLIWPNFADAFIGDAVARAAGLRARIDTETGWHKTLSNVAVAGTLGLSADVHFDLQDASTTAGVLNDAAITTLVSLNGRRFWGNRTCSDDALWAFESRVRTAQALQDSMAEGLAWAIDKPLTPQLARDIIETINAAFRRLKAEGRIIDGEVLPLDTEINSASALSAGTLALDYEFTDTAPLEGLTLSQRVTDRFYASFADQITRI